MGDSQDQQDAAEGVVLPEDASPAEPSGDEFAEAAAARAEDVDLGQPGADDSTDLAGLVASLDEPEQSEGSSDGEPISEVVDADLEIAALQIDLEAKVPEVEAAADSGAAAESPEVPTDVDEVQADAEPVAVAGVQEAAQDSKDITLPDDRAGVPLWPFLIYFALWVVFAGLLVWQLTQTPVGTPIYELDAYGISILIGLVLTALGPLLAIGVWLAVWIARPGARAGLFSRSMIIGAVTTLGGVTLWLVALGAVDMLRLGRLL